MDTVRERKLTAFPIIWIIAGIALALVLVVLTVLFLIRPNLSSQDETTVSQDGTTLSQEENPISQDENQDALQEDPGLLPNPFKASDFTYKNGRLHCTAGTAILGIDVSGWQGDINWEKVKQSGIEFAIIRVAGRGYGPSGALYIDSYAQKNYDGAKAAGIQVGAYFFSQAITPAEAIEEANYILDFTKDWELDFPIVYDWEYVNAQARTANLSPRTLTACTAAFCETIENAGREAMIYFNPDQSYKQFYIEELTKYDFWLAMYSNKMNYPYKVDMWQYSSTGYVPGISSIVDMNLYFPYDES